MPAVTTYSPTGDTYVNGVLGDYKWAVNSFTYSFPTSGSYYGRSYGSGESVTNFGAFNTAQQAATREVLKSVASVASVTFTEIGETTFTHADLRFAMSDKLGTAWAYFPSTAAEGGDAWFNNSNGYYSSPAKGNYAYATFLHETGHALGLEHAHEHFVMPADRDSMEYTVMSYRSYVGASTTSGYTNEAGGYAQSLMLYDIAALQHMYGANFSSNSGNTGYSFSPTTGEMFINGVGQGAPLANRVFQTIWDGGGVDTYNFSNYTTALKVSLEPGSWTTMSVGQLANLHWDGSKIAAGNLANALQYKGDARSLIENAQGGSAADSLTGNVGANTLIGNGGDDQLRGLGGNDVLDGGVGSDMIVLTGLRSQYSIHQLADGSLSLADMRAGAPDGSDTVWNSEWFQFADKVYSLAELTGGTAPTSPTTTVVTDVPAGPSEPSTDIAGITPSLTLTGTNANDAIYGEAGRDTLSGLAGSDILQGGIGADVLIGGSGIDYASYTAASSSVLVDLASRLGGSGEASGDTFSGIENILGGAYADSLRGSGGANLIKGGGGNDTIAGRGGNDVLDGARGNDVLFGGAGRDILVGGSGADTFVFQFASESRGAAADVIRDFRSGQDHINLRGIDANTTKSGNQAFSFIGGRDFSGAAGELSFSAGTLSGDVNGDAIADFQIKLSAVSMLRSGDLFL